MSRLDANKDEKQTNLANTLIPRKLLATLQLESWNGNVQEAL